MFSLHRSSNDGMQSNYCHPKRKNLDLYPDWCHAHAIDGVACKSMQKRGPQYAKVAWSTLSFTSNLLCYIFFHTHHKRDAMPRRTELEANIRLYMAQIHKLCTRWWLPEEHAATVLGYVFRPLLQLDPSTAEFERQQLMSKFASKCKHGREFRRRTRAMLEAIKHQQGWSKPQSHPQDHIRFFAHMVLNIDFVQHTPLYGITQSKLKQVRQALQQRACSQTFWSSRVLEHTLDQIAHTYSVSPSNKSVLCRSCNSHTSRALGHHWLCCHHHLCQRFDCGNRRLPKQADTPHPHRASPSCKKKKNV